MSAATSDYLCRYCRQPSDASGTTCPRCGAPVDVRAVVSRSGWVKQPAIPDETRIQFGGSSVQIQGNQVPTAHFTLTGQEWIYFGHHSLLWCDPSLTLQQMSLRQGWKRMLAGMPIVMTQAYGHGHVGLADNHAGEVVALPLQNGQAIIVREHRLLSATGNITYDWQSSPVWYVTGTGDERETHYPLGVYEDRFISGDSPGLLLLHAPGNTFVRDLAPNETLLLKPSALLYRDVTVSAHLHLEYPNTGATNQVLNGLLNFAGSAASELAGGFFAKRISAVTSSTWSNRNIWLRLVGPGRVAMQSVFEREEGSDYIHSSSRATRQDW